MLEIDDNTLAERIGNGDAQAFQTLVESHKKRVFYLSYDILGDHHDAEDISQEVFLKLYRTIHLFRHDAKMSSWLYQITVNTCIDHLRKKSSKKQDSVDALDEVDSRQKAWGISSTSEPEPQGDASLLQARIQKALDRLTVKERTIFVMKLYNDFKIKEIAEILDVTAGTVKSLLFRAVKKLKKDLSGYCGSPKLKGVSHE
jgi:RNA polymerase sigma-70 factor (ECF subfamily)